MKISPVYMQKYYEVQNPQYCIKKENTDINAANNITFGQLTRNYKKILHIILDGVGINENNITANPLIGNMPYLTEIRHGKIPGTLYRKILAAGESVGLDAGEPGNSEVGHSVMGAGRNIKQAMVRLDEAIADGSFFNIKEFLNAMNWAKEHDSTLHILGSVGYSHTHSKIEHIEELIKMAKMNGVKKLSLHAFLNGEGPTAKSSIQYIKRLNKTLKENGYPQISSLIGRNIALDKSGDVSKIEKGYRMLTGDIDTLTKKQKNSSDLKVVEDGSASKVKVEVKVVDDIEVGLEEQLKSTPGVSLEPVILKNSPRIKDNDAVIFANYRTDRPKDLTAALAYKDCKFKFLKGLHRPDNLYFVCMTEYDPIFKLPTALDALKYEGTLKENLLDNNWHITSVAQKEKHSHVTFFYNGSKDIKNEHVTDFNLPGCIDPKELPHSLDEQVALLQNIMTTDKHDKHFIVANLANGDIIGHKGNPEQSKAAARDIDNAVQKLIETASQNDYAVVINADHGNIENGFSTKHTENPVPFIVMLPKHVKQISKNLVKIDTSTEAALRDVAPTILDLAGLPKGQLMTGKSLLIEA